MIATIISAEPRESRASGMPYLAVKLRVEEDEAFMFVAPIYMCELYRACYLPIIQDKSGRFKFNPDKLKGKIISVGHDRIKFMDREYDRYYFNKRTW